MTSIISCVLHLVQYNGFSPGTLKVACFPHEHLLFMTSTISSVLHFTQHTPILSPGTLKLGRFPHKHLLCTTSIISSVLHFTQHTPIFSPGKLKLGCFPHGHFLFTTSTISSALHFTQHTPVFSPGMLNFGLFPHGHFRGISLYITKMRLLNQCFVDTRFCIIQNASYPYSCFFRINSLLIRRFSLSSWNNVLWLSPCFCSLILLIFC
jgi:hypothetical protein